jgi:hypothetical protein
MTDQKRKVATSQTTDTAVGYKRPPVQSRFKPGQSGNPSGRPKGSQNLKTLFNKILKEEVSLREGAEVRTVSKAEALMRGLVIGALKGDTRSLGTLLRFAEQTGQFDEPHTPVSQITRIVLTGVPRPDDHPANWENNSDDHE